MAPSPYCLQLLLIMTAARHISPCLRKDGSPVLTIRTPYLKLHKSDICSLTTLHLDLTHIYIMARLIPCPARVAMPAPAIPSPSTLTNI